MLKRFFSPCWQICQGSTSYHDLKEWLTVDWSCCHFVSIGFISCWNGLILECYLWTGGQTLIAEPKILTRRGVYVPEAQFSQILTLIKKNVFPLLFLEQKWNFSNTSFGIVYYLPSYFIWSMKPPKNAVNYPFDFTHETSAENTIILFLISPSNTSWKYYWLFHSPSPTPQTLVDSLRKFPLVWC